MTIFQKSKNSLNRTPPVKGISFLFIPDAANLEPCFYLYARSYSTPFTALVRREIFLDAVFL